MIAHESIWQNVQIEVLHIIDERWSVCVSIRHAVRTTIRRQQGTFLWRAGCIIHSSKQNASWLLTFVVDLMPAVLP